MERKGRMFIYMKRLLLASVVFLIFAGFFRCHSVAQVLSDGEAAAFADSLSYMTVIPLLLAVILAIYTKDTLISVFFSELVAVIMLVLLRQPSLRFLVPGSIQLYSVSVESSLLDPFNLDILLMILCTCGMIEVIHQYEGFTPLATRITRAIRSPKRVNLITLLLGGLVSFDDYSSVIIVAPIMKPIVDKLNVSREKLAFIVDATAAPFAALMFISTWVSTEILAIDNGFAECGIQDSSYIAFLRSIPFGLYSILCLAFIFMGGIMGVEFGPMLKVEREARRKTVESAGKKEAAQVEGSVVIPIIPIIFFILYILGGFLYTGRNNMLAEKASFTEGASIMRKISELLGYSDTGHVLFQAAALSSIIAIIIYCAKKHAPLQEALGAWIEGIRGSISTAVLLILTWTFAGSIADLGACIYIVNLMTKSVAVWLVPLVIFLACCIISFSIGSIGTLFIAMPIAIPVAHSFITSGAASDPQHLLTAAIACVLSGALFGDHCSPISDTTILTSQTCGISNMDHVRTQLPYALTIAGAASVGYIMTGLGISAWISIVVGILILWIVLKVFGKDPARES